MLIFYVLMFGFAVETTVFGQPLGSLFGVDTTYIIVLRAGNVMLVFMVLSILSAFAYDIHAADGPVWKARVDAHGAHPGDHRGDTDQQLAGAQEEHQGASRRTPASSANPDVG